MLFSYPFLVPIISVILAELCKICLDSYHKKSWTMRTFFHAGGMPSGHAALMGALVSIIFIIEGVQSIAFAIVVTVSIVVIYDAINIRRQAGKHAIVLNRLQTKEKLDERLGHTFLQVCAGFVFGIISTYLLLLV